MADPQQSAPSGEPDGLDHGTFEVVRDRLVARGRELDQRAQELNRRRLELFGGAELEVVGSVRIRTENNCVPRDLAAVGEHLLFGYNVFLGLRSETQVADVLSLHRFEQGEQGFSLHPVEPGSGSFLDAPGFASDFRELFQYYRSAQLAELQAREGRLLAVVQTGETLDDLKAFRWKVANDGAVSYVDNRGERDLSRPPSHDFEWTPTDRSHHVDGRHPHVSILDELFVEAVGGTLTVKVENNTEDGQGVFSEPVEDANQSLEDAEIHYARTGALILVSVLPYRENQRRYLVFNSRTRQVKRIDAIGQACVQLPEDHGIIFPGGYYLQTGESKRFDGDVEGMEFTRRLRSPNGEDVLFVFHERKSGRYVLLPYNTIRREVQSPVLCHGYSVFDDGRMVVFHDRTGEPTRVHTIQIWRTPFTSDEVAAERPSTGSYLETIGNAELVRLISEAFSLRRAVENQQPSRPLYESILATATRLLDHYPWLEHEEVGGLHGSLAGIVETVELVIDEFEKVEALRAQAGEALQTCERSVVELFGTLRPQQWSSVDAFVRALAALRRKRGELISLRELRYVDLAALEALEAQVAERFTSLSDATAGYLLQDEALTPYREQIDAALSELEGLTKVAEAGPLQGRLEALGGELDVLTDLLGGIEIEDATQRTRILEGISEVYAGLNRGKALIEARRKELLSSEGQAEFAVQFRLFGQSVTSALGMADSPEKCDEQLGRLMVQLEELESRFGEFDAFLDELATKREDVYEAFSTRKQALLDERGRRAQRTMKAAERILEGIVRRASAISSGDEINAYFASDAMVLKLRDQIAHLRELEDAVRADELESRLKSSREEAARSLRDRQDLYEDGAAVIQLGRHRFSVNTQPLDATIVPADPGMALHLTGTDYHEPIEDERFEATRPYWSQVLVSETPEVYRSEYLAASLLSDAEARRGGLDLERLRQAALSEDELRELVRRHAAERYDEGYERGLHDEDARLVLAQLLHLHAAAGVLRFPPRPRALAGFFWAHFDGREERAERELIERRARSLGRLRGAFGRASSADALARELGERVRDSFAAHRIALDADETRAAGSYLFEELAAERREFVTSAEARTLARSFSEQLAAAGQERELREDLRVLEKQPIARWQLARAWLEAYVDSDPRAGKLAPAADEAAVLLVTERRLSRVVSEAQTCVRVEGLLGQHPRVQERGLELRLDEFLARLSRFRRERVPGFRAFQAERTRVLEEARERLRLSEFKPRVMSAFVRNQLIDRVYLPMIGDNLAKQVGALGDAKRTDNMGLLLLISPPGYGKTMLMEYLADRLGLVFLKVNGPTLGHAVTSLDPAAAPNAAARQEVEKINLGFEMGNNVLLYLDDIQHTHPELLQKFISLCDGQRRVEGVWRGETRTYDLRGKRFAVCMAGNPYTESGEKFQIPDMLANRADVYNLGDVLSGKDELFALSYIENVLTSNPVLSQLTAHDLADVGVLVRMARGEEVGADALSHAYSAVELEEILSVLKKLLRVQEVLLAVNGEYIRSASMDDAFRSEPRFQLQGSYRNMNKLAEKIVPVMNQDELEALIDDHYQGEAQTLTTGAEHNLLKLGELRGRLGEEQAARWHQIKRDFRRLKELGGDDEDAAVRVTRQLGLVNDRLDGICTAIGEAAAAAAPGAGAADEPALADLMAPLLDRLAQSVTALHETRGAAPPPVSAGPDLGAASQHLADMSRRLSEIGDSITLASAGLGDRDPLAAVTPVLEKLDETLASFGSAPAANGSGGEAFGPYLQKLDATLQALVAAPRGGEVVQALGPGVIELIDKMTLSIGETLLPLLRAIEKRARIHETDHRLQAQMNRTLKNFDMLKDLLEALKKIDTRDLLRRRRRAAAEQERESGGQP